MNGDLQVTTLRPRTANGPATGHERHCRQSGDEGVHSDADRGLPPNVTVDMTQLKDIARHYMVTVLTENRYADIASQFPPVMDPDQSVHRLIDGICAQLEKERARQFDEIIASLTITNDTLEDTYRQLVTHIFQDGVNWGRIITFLVFSGRLSLHCARCGMQNRVRDIVEWTEDEMRERIHSWVMERGGWAAFVRHYDDDSWKLSLSSFLAVTGMLAFVLASGVFMVKRFFFSA